MKNKIYGINKINPLSIEPIIYKIYCSCKNCGNKWEEESSSYAVTSQMTNKKYDYCSECFKEE